MTDTTATDATATDDAADAAVAEGEQAPERETRHGAPVTWSFGQQVLHAAPDRYLDLMRSLRDDGFDMCIDVTAVDYLADAPRDLPEDADRERFEVVVNLLSMERRERVRVRVQVPQGDPRVPSLFPLYPGSEAMEREVFDMFGIVFDAHPDLTRILMPDDWEGHPLRKDYSIGRIPVQFKHPPATR